MSFNDIAIHDGRMARVELLGNLVIIFYRYQVIDPFFHHGEPMFFQVGAPIATAASGGCLKHGHHAWLINNRQRIGVSCLITGRKDDEQQGDDEQKSTFHAESSKKFVKETKMELASNLREDYPLA